MSNLPSLGPPAPMPEESPPIPIDLGAHQQRIVAQIQQCEGQLVALDRQRQQLADMIMRLRGGLDLLATLAGA